ncbi:hypothetical protein Nepgr_031353 [Nepenthes gracilis]|uniref:Uncharacterized protein n=1 Tax=Nepenthes gracilis TaxID=150966 RepID=A0AAD3TGJ6_NEPGR|nr:hypothetical protein Nepgr_031353 [Nepenthes gracilis]
MEIFSSTWPTKIPKHSATRNPLLGPTLLQKMPTRQNVRNGWINLGQSLEKEKESLQAENTPARNSAGLGPQNAETTSPPPSHP